MKVIGAANLLLHQRKVKRVEGLHWMERKGGTDRKYGATETFNSHMKLD